MDYTEHDSSKEFSERVSSMLRTTWLSWQIARHGELKVRQQLRDSNELAVPREAAELSA